MPSIYSQPHGGMFELADGETAKWHATAFGSPSDGTVTPVSATGLINLGVFDNATDDVTGDSTLHTKVGVDFCKEVPGRWYPTADTLHAFQIVYQAADGSATSTNTAHAKLGMVLFTDTVKGVFVVDPALLAAV